MGIVRMTAAVSGARKVERMTNNAHARFTSFARFTLIAALLTAAACADRGAPQVVAVPAAELEKPGTMSVTGTAVLDISPDCADLTMTLVGEGARPGQATAAVGRQEQELAL